MAEVLQAGLWIALVAAVGAGTWFIVRPVVRFRSEHSTTVLHALRTARRDDWHLARHGRADKIEALVPVDPTCRRRVVDRLRSADPDVAGVAIVAAEIPNDGGAESRVFYVLTPVEVGDAEVTYVRALDSLSRTHASRGSLADRAVRAIREAVPDVHMVWVGRGHVGIGLDAETMTNPTAWARWMGKVVAAVETGRPLLPPPARW